MVKSMKVIYKKGADSIYIELNPTQVNNTKVVETDVSLNYSKQGAVVGIEIRHAQKHLPGGVLKDVEFIHP